MTAASATLELERFAWADGAFVVAGRWHADEPAGLGRARLVAQVDGRRRRIGAQGGGAVTAAPGGEPWEARFTCARRPSSTGTAELEVGTLIVELPPPELPEPATPAPDVSRAEALLERLRGERAELEAATDRLARERAAAEEAGRRLAEERRAAEAAAEEARTERQATEAAAAEAVRAAQQAAEADEPRRAPWSDAPTAPTAPLPRTAPPSREAVRPLERRPRRSAPPDEPRRQRALGYALAAAILIVIALLVVLLL